MDCGCEKATSRSALVRRAGPASNWTQRGRAWAHSGRGGAGSIIPAVASPTEARAMTVRPYRDRTEAGRYLAKKLADYAGRPDVLVLALPRGGVPVAHEVAQALGVPLDVFLVRKLGVPGHEELAMGAIASGGLVLLNQEMVRALGIGSNLINEVISTQRAELERRDRQYRGDRPPPDVRGKTVILIDDGLATGASMRAAVSALRQQH